MPTLYIAPDRARFVRRIFTDNNGRCISIIDVFCTGTHHIERHSVIPLGDVPGVSIAAHFVHPTKCDCLSESIALPAEALELIRQFKSSETPVGA